MTTQPAFNEQVEPRGHEAERQPLPDQVYSQIIDLILRGEFHEQSKLPTEAELSARFAVSRPTIREALSRLRSDGVVESRRGSGSYVVRMPDVGAIRRRTAVESIEDIERYYAFRVCIESGAAGLAAEKHEQPDLQAIQAAYEALSVALDGDAHGIEEDLTFHLAIAAASHNQFFVSTIEFIVGPIRQCMELARNLFPTKSSGRRDLIQQEHQAILDAIIRRSAAQASEAMHAHITNARRRIFEGK